MKSVLSIIIMLFVVAWAANAQDPQTTQTGNQSTSQTSGTSSGDIQKSIKDGTTAFASAMKDKNVDKIMATYWNNPGLVAVYPDTTLKGYDEVRNYWTNFFAKNDLKDVTIDQSNVEAHSDVAVENGTFTMNVAPKNLTGTVSARGGMDSSSTISSQGNSAGMRNERMMGERMNEKGRFINIWEPKDGKWVVTLVQASYPVPSEPMGMEKMHEQMEGK